MKEYKIAVIPGDGIGIEVVESAIEIITQQSKNKNYAFTLKYFDWSSEYYFKHNVMMPKDGISELKNFDAILEKINSILDAPYIINNDIIYIC